MTPKEVGLPPEKIDEAHRAGQVAWPALSLDAARFAARVSAAKAPAEGLEAHAADLYLASACAEGDPAALAAFDRTYMPAVKDYVARFSPTADMVEEIRQRLRIRLLTGAEPKIALYAGTGPLGAWVRVSAMRVALNYLDGPERERSVASPIGEALLQEGVPGPEAEVVRSRYRTVFLEAVEKALRELSARDRTLLRLHFVDGLGIDGLAAVYRVHRATAARWLVALRRRLFEEVRRSIGIDLRSSSTELRSLVDVFRADLKISLDRVLR